MHGILKSESWYLGKKTFFVYHGCEFGECNIFNLNILLMLSASCFHVLGNFLWDKNMPDLFLLFLIYGKGKYYKIYTWHVVTNAF